MFHGGFLHYLAPMETGKNTLLGIAKF